MRAYDIYSRITPEEGNDFARCYVAFTYTAEVIVDYCADITFNKVPITQDEEMKLLQAAVFLIKEARKHQHTLGFEGALDVVLGATTDKLNQLLHMRA
jgi:hypothetical protein